MDQLLFLSECQGMPYVYVALTVFVQMNLGSRFAEDSFESSDTVRHMNNRRKPHVRVWFLAKRCLMQAIRDTAMDNPQSPPSCLDSLFLYLPYNLSKGRSRYFNSPFPLRITVARPWHFASLRLKTTPAGKYLKADKWRLNHPHSCTEPRFYCVTDPIHWRMPSMPVAAMSSIILPSSSKT